MVRQNGPPYLDGSKLGQLHVLPQEGNCGLWSRMFRKYLDDSKLLRGNARKVLQVLLAFAPAPNLAQSSDDNRTGAVAGGLLGLDLGGRQGSNGRWKSLLAGYTTDESLTVSDLGDHTAGAGPEAGRSSGEHRGDYDCL